MVTVRRVGTDDTPLLVALMAEFYAESEFSLDRQWASDSFSALLGDDAKGAVWIAFQDGEPAGYVVLHPSAQHGVWRSRRLYRRSLRASSP